MSRAVESGWLRDPDRFGDKGGWRLSLIILSQVELQKSYDF